MFCLFDGGGAAALTAVKRQKSEDSLLDVNDHASWRSFMASRIAGEMDLIRFGVSGIYLVGSTDSGEAGIGSDIDLVIVFDGAAEERKLLEQWLDGWSGALAAMNFIRTGYRARGGLLDIHIVTESDLRRRDSFATMTRSEADSTLLRKRDS